ncbi:MAG: right-handed parallel beta-helix repeat-containing protein [Opitutaceae bacterium]
MKKLGIAFMFVGLSILRGESRPLHSLSPAVYLPDGKEFMTWESAGTPVFEKTYYVARENPAASDANPGTEALPFASIGRAAALLEPGERVVVGTGVYRETIAPRRGGTGPDRMISYESAPGATVIVKGAIKYRPNGMRAPGKSGGDNVWVASVSDELFGGDYNPFNTQNILPQQFKDWLISYAGKFPFSATRGMIFQGERLLKQVATRDELSGEEGSFWINRADRLLYLHPYDNISPDTGDFEVTNRETLFAPPFVNCPKCHLDHPSVGLGYIRIKGFTFERVAGPWPGYQLGAISTGAGHHWIIEDNTVRQVNGVGIDLGVMHGHQSSEVENMVGHHIVRRNVVMDCGICGIAGLGPKGDREFGLLIEDNVLVGNAFYEVEKTLQETGAIKTHQNKRCLIRRNFIANTRGGPGIWMDWNNGFSRCTQNIIINTHSPHGAIFVEFSMDPNLVDRNVIWGTDGNGIYEHDTRGNLFENNFIGFSSGSAFHLHGKISERQLSGRETLVAGAHVVMHNVEVGNRTPDFFSGEGSFIENNLASGLAASLDTKTMELRLSASDKLPARDNGRLVGSDLYDVQFAVGSASCGPFSGVKSESKLFRLWPLSESSPALPEMKED